MNIPEPNNLTSVNSPYLIQRTNEAVINNSKSEKINGNISHYRSDPTNTDKVQKKDKK